MELEIKHKGKIIKLIASANGDVESEYKPPELLHCLVCGHVWEPLLRGKRVENCGHCKHPSFNKFPEGFEIKQSKCVLCKELYRFYVKQYGKVETVKLRRASWSMHDTPDLSPFLKAVGSAA